MKKTLAIVLALTMVLCMIPAAFANTTKTITDKSYGITAASVGTKTSVVDPKASNANSATINYNYEDEDTDVTGKFTEDKKMALVTITGFDANLPANSTVTIDGKDLELNSSAAYLANCGFKNAAVTFPVELTKAGYSDTYLITVKGTAGTEDITETAKITLKFVNKSSYKTAKTATISSIVGTGVDAYIVGSKIYLDYAGAATDTDSVKLTFKDENGAKFTAVTWAYNATSKNGVNSIFQINNANNGLKLDGSAAKYTVWANTSEGNYDGNMAKEVKFQLETASAIYETKEYTVVVRKNIVEDDPKGIYFAESTKTIKVGESYSPAVIGVATGKVLPYRDGVGAASKLKIDYGKGTSKQYIDVTDNAVIGTQEGVAYITAKYWMNNNTTDTANYEASSMKIIVVAADGNTETPTTGTTYTVTCRVLNVRKGAGTSFAKAGKVTRGTKVEVVSIENGWAKLANGTFVASKYISK